MALIFRDKDLKKILHRSFLCAASREQHRLSLSSESTFPDITHSHHASRIRLLSVRLPADFLSWRSQITQAHQRKVYDEKINHQVSLSNLRRTFGIRHYMLRGAFRGFACPLQKNCGGRLAEISCSRQKQSFTVRVFFADTSDAHRWRHCNHHAADQHQA